MANIPIYGTLKNETPEGKLAVAAQILDETEEKKQSEINAETVRITEQTLEEAQKEQVKKNIGLPIYAYFNETSAEERRKSGISIDYRIFREEIKNQVGNTSIALGALNKNMGVMSVTLGYQNVTSDGFGEGMGMMPGSFFMGSMLSDHDNDTFSAIGYRNNSVYKDGPEGKSVGSFLTISIPYPYEHDIYGKNLAVFGTDDNLYIHGIGGYDGGSLNGKAPILAEHKSLQEVLTDLDTRCPTAVEDGKTYGWKDGKWVELTAPAGGYNRALYEAAGAVFNEDTGFYDLNGLNDITEAQMDKIFAAGHPSVDFDCALSSSYNIPTNEIRTNLMPNDIWGTGNRKILNLKQAFIENFVIENACLGIINGSLGISAGTTMYYAFYNCKKLRRIVVTGRGRITETAILYVNNVNTFEGAFALCAELKDIKLYGIAYDISFKDSPNLTKESILFAIKNAALKTFTLTLHATAYAMAMADEDIQAALAEKTNVSLASA